MFATEADATDLERHARRVLPGRGLAREVIRDLRGRKPRVGDEPVVDGMAQVHEPPFAGRGAGARPASPGAAPPPAAGSTAPLRPPSGGRGERPAGLRSPARWRPAAAGPGGSPRHGDSRRW